MALQQAFLVRYFHLRPDGVVVQELVVAKNLFVAKKHAEAVLVRSKSRQAYATVDLHRAAVMTTSNPGRARRSRTLFATSFCNFPHVLETGRPVDHECEILPTTALRAEKEGDFDRAAELMSTRPSPHYVRGRTTR